MNTPVSVKGAVLLWSIAVAAGAAEMSLAVAETASEGILEAGVWVDIGLRSLVYTGAALLILAFAHGRRWARLCLAVLLSAIGLAAMVIPSAMLMADGEAFARAFGSDGDLATAFSVVRMIHIVAVVAATVLMFTPAADRHFR